MSWTVISTRLPWPAGTTITAEDLRGCNISALAEAGHLQPAPDRKTEKADEAAQEE